jgi:predicted nucleic acid-binding protein
LLLSNFVGDERIFIDANIFIYNALDDPMYADSSSDLAEAAQHLEKFTLPNLKKEMKKSSFSSKVYKPVKEYSDYLTELTYSGLKILIVDAGVIEKSIDLGSRYGLLTTDAIHLSTIKQYGINNIATNDSDFERVDSITLYKPEKSKA